MATTQWTSALTETTADRIALRGYDLADLIGRVGFSSALLLLYTGELPSRAEERMVEALMVASIDHGPVTPSALAARVATSGGATLQAAAAAGLLAMGERHGAAVESCMALLTRVATNEDDLTTFAQDYVSAAIAPGVRLPGFGHREHKQRDPRIDRLFSLATELGLPDLHVRAVGAVEAALQRCTGHTVPANIDGAMAGILCDLEFPPELANALFIGSRMFGVLRHAIEEQTMPPMRRIDPTSHVYTGPPTRSLPKEY